MTNSTTPPDSTLQPTTMTTEGHEAPSPNELGQRAKDLARDASKTAADQANAAGARGMARVGEAINRAADYVDERGAEIATKEGAKVSLDQVQSVSDRIRAAGQYMHEHDPAGLATDIDRAVKAHPYRAMFAGVAFGWVVGRLFSRD